MEFYPSAPGDVIGQQCSICDSEIDATSPVYTDTHEGRLSVDHSWCREAVEGARAKAWLDAANLAYVRGLPEFANQCKGRASQVLAWLRPEAQRRGA